MLYTSFCVFCNVIGGAWKSDPAQFPYSFYPRPSQRYCTIKGRGWHAKLQRVGLYEIEKTISSQLTSCWDAWPYMVSPHLVSQVTLGACYYRPWALPACHAYLLLCVTLDDCCAAKIMSCTVLTASESCSSCCSSRVTWLGTVRRVQRLSTLLVDWFA